MKKIIEMDLDTPSAKIFDWVLSFTSIAVGIWLGSTLWIIGGCIGCLASYFRPLTMIQKMARGIVTRRASNS